MYNCTCQVMMLCFVHSFRYEANSSRYFRLEELNLWCVLPCWRQIDGMDQRREGQLIFWQTTSCQICVTTIRRIECRCVLKHWDNERWSSNYEHQRAWRWCSRGGSRRSASGGGLVQWRLMFLYPITQGHLLMKHGAQCISIPWMMKEEEGTHMFLMALDYIPAEKSMARLPPCHPDCFICCYWCKPCINSMHVRLVWCNKNKQYTNRMHVRSIF